MESPKHNSLSTIHYFFPMVIAYKKRCSKFSYELSLSPKKDCRMITFSSNKTDQSVFVDYYQYLSHNYNINFNDGLTHIIKSMIVLGVSLHYLLIDHNTLTL